MESLTMRAVCWSLLLLFLGAFTLWRATYPLALAEAQAAYEGRRPDDRQARISRWARAMVPDRIFGSRPKPRQPEPAAQTQTKPDHHKALERALDHLADHPGDPAAARITALCLSQLDYPSEAEPYYLIARRQQALSLDDLGIRAFGLAHGNLRAQAVTAYREILDQRTDDPEALQRLAAIYYSLSQYNDALSTAQRLARSPITSQAVAGYALIGIVHHDQHRPGPAVAANEKVLELDPKLETLSLPVELFFADLAQDLVDLNRASDARRYIHRVLGQRDDPVLTDILGSAYYSEGQEDEAERCWKRAVELDPRYHRPWLNLGKLALRRGRLEEVVPYLEQAHSLDRRSHETAYQLSLAYRRLGRAEDSERYRKLAESLRLDNPRNKRGTGLIPHDKP
jgi:tetratricopeptide (TPR) repeat protein